MTETPSSLPPLQFLKLGGSLICDKAQPHTARPEVLRRLAQEVASALERDPGLALLLGHGSGSFGHVPARRYGTRQGVHTPQEWDGFVEVWQEAAALNHIVMDALRSAGLPAIAFQPSASVTASDGAVLTWDLSPLLAALRAGLLPVVYGDVIFDVRRGGTILSTEDLFGYLALELQPVRILLAGLEPGVWADYPVCERLLREVTPQTLGEVESALSGSDSIDVTGGMASKVRQGLALAQALPGLEVRIFSGVQPGQVEQALLGAAVGTALRPGN